MNKTTIKILMGMALLSSLQAAEADLDEKSKNLNLRIGIRFI